MIVQVYFGGHGSNVGGIWEGRKFIPEKRPTNDGTGCNSQIGFDYTSNTDDDHADGAYWSPRCSRQSWKNDGDKKGQQINVGGID